MSSSSKQPELLVFSNNPRLSDIKFVVGPAENPLQQSTFHGHKILFAAKSAVLDAMFASDIPIKDNEVRITDVEARIFELFIKFIYHQDKVDLAMDFVQQDGPLPVFDLIKLAYVANKYLVDDLAQKCCGLIMVTLSNEGKDKLTAENALGLWEMMLAYIPDTAAAKGVQEFVDKYAVDIIKTEEFLQLDTASMTKFMASDSLNVPREEHLFQALWIWAWQKCSGKKERTTRKNLRDIMGPALYQIRFLTMDFYTFRSLNSHVLYTLLTEKEINDIFNFMSTSEIYRDKFLCYPFNTNCRHSTQDSFKNAENILGRAKILPTTGQNRLSDWLNVNLKT